MRGQRPAEDLRGDVRIRRAAGMREQAGVVGLARRRAVDAEPLGEPGRDQRGVQAVLERKPHTEIGGKAQRGHELRAADLLAALRRFG